MLCIFCYSWNHEWNKCWSYAKRNQCRHTSWSQELIRVIRNQFLVRVCSSLEVKEKRKPVPRRGGGGYSHTLPIRVCASKGVVILKLLMSCRTGYPFQRRFLERGIIFRTQERSSSFVSSHLKLFKDRLFLKIRFNALTRKLLHSCCTLERSIKNWPISRTGYQF